MPTPCLPVLIAAIALLVAVEGPAFGSYPASAKVDTGFVSGPAAWLSSADIARIASRPLQDLLDPENGRYTQIDDDGVSGCWGLSAIRSRQEAAEKPYADLRRGGFFQSERVIFADLTTGATLMKLSDEPYGAGDELNYFGKSCFNADGSLMTWQRTRKPNIWGSSGETTTETHGPVVMDSDGTHLRVVQGWPERIRPPVVCHPLNPDLGYVMNEDQLLELDLRAGTVRRVVATGMPAWCLKISPDGKYACNDDYSRGPITVVSLETGEKWVMKLTGRIHDSYRFVPGNTDWIMYWYEADGSDHWFHMMNFKTGEERVFDFKYDWNHGDMGRRVGVHEIGNVYSFDGERWHLDGNAWWPEQTGADAPPFYNIPYDYNGYCQYWPDDQLWAYGTLITDRPYLSEISAWFAKPLASGRANRFRICCTNLYRNTDRTGAKSVVLDRPNISPDGTKLLFNSNVFGSSEVYLAVLRNPLPPVNVKAEWVGSGVAVTWQPPRYRRESAGYLVYRSTESGRGFEPLFESPMAQTEFTDRSAKPGRVYHYAVRSVEHSRLESPLSAEAAAASDRGLVGGAPLRLFLEAEDAIPAGLDAPSPDSLWLNFDGTASNLYYVWQRRSDRPGTAALPISVPRASDYFVFARMRGKQGARFEVGSQTLSLPASAAWAWARSARPIQLSAGPQDLTIASSAYGSCLDCICLSTDRDFDPTGRVSAAVPSPPTLHADAENGRPRLIWSDRRSPRWGHYNLYSSNHPGFACDRSTIIASPDAPEHVDWRAPAGRNCYKVTQVTLDGLESAPSNEVAAER